MNETTTTQDNLAMAGAAAPVYRPKFTIYHANGKGTGGAVQFELHPAHDRVDGSIMMTMASQLTVGNRSASVPTYPRFDWDNAVTVKLDFNDLCSFLQVFRGECETINDEHGLYHTTAQAATKIDLRHLVTPVSGYSLEVYRTPRNGGEEIRVRVFLGNSEALGLAEAIAGSMSVICFGIPMVIPRDTTAYRARQREARHVAA